MSLVLLFLIPYDIWFRKNFFYYGRRFQSFVYRIQAVFHMLKILFKIEFKNLHIVQKMYGNVRTWSMKFVKQDLQNTLLILLHYKL